MIEIWNEVVELLEKFYTTRGRKFPWRAEKDPFRVFIAEVLLQKTPAERCIEVYEELLEKYPSCETLASASDEELKPLFSRIGLFKRGKWLKEACSFALKEFNGLIPSNEVELKKLKGVGDYTARAVSLVLKGRGKLPVDVNIRRVLSRLGVPEDFWDELIISREAFYGLIDLAALVCKRKKPKCDSCPLSILCTFASAKVKSIFEKEYIVNSKIGASRLDLMLDITRELKKRLELAPLEEKVPHLGVIPPPRGRALTVREDPFDILARGAHAIGASFLDVKPTGKFEATFSFVIRRGPVNFGGCFVCKKYISSLWRFEVLAQGTLSDSFSKASLKVKVYELSWNESSNSYDEKLAFETPVKTFTQRSNIVEVDILDAFPKLDHFLVFPLVNEEAIYQVSSVDGSPLDSSGTTTVWSNKVSFVDSEVPKHDFVFRAAKTGNTALVILKNLGVSFKAKIAIKTGSKRAGTKVVEKTLIARQFTPKDDLSSTWTAGAWMEAKTVIEYYGVEDKKSGDILYWPKNVAIGIGGLYEATYDPTKLSCRVEVTPGAIVKVETSSDVAEVSESLRESLECLMREFSILAEEAQDRYREIAECLVEAVSKALSRKGVEKLRDFQLNAARSYARLLRVSGLRSSDELPSAIVLKATTAAGKTLAFLLPTLFAICARRAKGLKGTTAIFVYPTRALALDQTKSVLYLLWYLNDELEKRGHEPVRVGILAGETPSLKQESEGEIEVGYRFRHPENEDKAVRVKVTRIGDYDFDYEYYYDDTKDLLDPQDVSKFKKALSVVRDDIYANPPDILVTTPDTLNLRLMDLPESHSILGRKVKVCSECSTVYINERKQKCDICGSNIKNIRMITYAPPEVIVVDEAHQIRGSFGGQVSYVFSRLERAIREYLRWNRGRVHYAPLYIFSSATFKDARRRVLQFFRINKLPKERVVEVEPKTIGRKDAIRIHFFAKPNVYGEAATLARALERLRKIWSEKTDSNRPPRTIVFVNSIAENNLLTLTLRDRLVGWKIEGHSTDYSIKRSEIEDAFSRGDIDLLVATSGLEVGVDFDEVDVIVIHGAPSYLADYRQRIGRAGRRPSKRPALIVHIFKDKPIDHLYKRYFELVCVDEKVEEALKKEDAPLPILNTTIRKRAIERALIDFLATRPDAHKIYGNALAYSRGGQAPKLVKVSSPSSVGEGDLDPYIYANDGLNTQLVSYVVEASASSRSQPDGDRSFVEDWLRRTLVELSRLRGLRLVNIYREKWASYRMLTTLRQSDDQVVIDVDSNAVYAKTPKNRNLGFFMYKYYDGSIFSYTGVNLVITSVVTKSTRDEIPLKKKKMPDERELLPPVLPVPSERTDERDNLYEIFKKRYERSKYAIEEDVEEGGE